VQHILAFTVLTALAATAYPKARLVVIGVGLGLVGAAIEVLQMISSLNRDGSVVDWLADCGAIVFVLVLAVAARRWVLINR
jgi:VanZ family protein